MPSERFYNLPKEKKERIIDAAYEELSKVSYNKLSINQVIKTANIPRGSFYEYFDGKDDLLRLIMRNFSDVFSKEVSDSFNKNNGDIFAVIEHMYDIVVEYAMNSRHRQVCENIFKCFAPGSNSMEELLRLRSEDREKLISKELTGGRYNIKNEEEAIALWSMLTSLLAVNIGRTFIDKAMKLTIRDRFKKQLNFIKYGVLN